MERITPTRRLALRIWWAFVWRACLCAVTVSFLIGMVFGATMLMFPMSEGVKEIIEVTLAFFLAAAISVEVMYRVLKKPFKDFEIVLVARKDNNE